MYTPVAQRKIAGTGTGGYSPVLERTPSIKPETAGGGINLGTGTDPLTRKPAPNVTAMSPVLTVPAQNIKIDIPASVPVRKSGKPMEFRAFSTNLTPEIIDTKKAELDTRMKTLENETKNVNLTDPRSVQEANTKIQTLKSDIDSFNKGINDYNLATNARRVISTPSGVPNKPLSFTENLRVFEQKMASEIAKKQGKPAIPAPDTEMVKESLTTLINPTIGAVSPLRAVATGEGKVSKYFLERLAKTKNASEIEDIIKPYNPPEIKILSDKLAKTNTVQEVKDVILEIEQQGNLFQDATKRLPEAGKSAYVPVSERAAVSKFVSTEGAEVGTLKDFPEAIKENWVRGEDEFNRNSSLSGSGKDLFFSNSEDIAGDYGKIRKIEPEELPKNPLVINGGKESFMKDIGYNEEKWGSPLAESKVQPEEETYDFLIRKYAQERGYDGVVYKSGSMDAPELVKFGEKSKTESKQETKSSYVPVAERTKQPELKGDMDAASEYARELRDPQKTSQTLEGINPKQETPLTPQEAKPLAAKATEQYWNDVVNPAKNEGQAQVIGADDLKDHFGKDYNVNNHPAYSKAADDLFKKAVDESPTSTVKFTVGGTGSGKSDFLVPDMSEGYKGVIYDSTGWNYEGIKKQIDYAKAKGKDAEVYAIIPDIARSRAYTFLREVGGKHPVTEAAFIRTHSKAIETLKKLIQAGEDVYVLDTRSLRDLEDVGKAEYLHNPIDLLNDLKYTEDHVKKSISGITKENAEAFIREGKKGTSSVSQKDGADKVAKIEKAASRAKAGEDFGPRTNLKQKPAPKKERSVAVPKNVELPAKLYEQQSQIEGFNEMIAQAKERLSEHPGKKLQDFISRKTGQFEDFRNPDLAKTPSEKKAIEERNVKVMKSAQSALEGSEFSDQFDNPDAIRSTIDEYKKLKEDISGMTRQRIEAKRAFYEARKEFFTKELDRRSMNSIVARQERLKVLKEVEKILRKEGRSRKEKIDAIADFFNLTDAEMKKLNTGNKDYRLMSDKEFENHMKGIEGKAYEVAAHRELVLEIENTIKELELIKVDNLREAMKLKKFENMSKNELEQFNDLLQTFKKKDEFLGKRQLQTVRFTDLAGIHTKREALAFLAKEAGVPIEELKNIEVKELDKFLYDSPLSRKNPFYKVMVDNTNLAEVEAGGRFFKIKRETEKLITEARSSRKKSPIDKLIPTDKMIFDYLEGDAETKIQLAIRMTPQEYKAANYIKDEYEKVRDYLLEQEVLKKNQYKQNYVTHTRRGFLEAWKESTKDLSLTKGFKDAVKELFDGYKEQSAVFNILDQKTGEVLPLEKFFKFSMTRKGNLVPTKNVSKAFLEYMRAFEQKRQFDSFIPKLDIFAHVLSPQAKTPRGLEMDDSLKRFVKTWINSKKGRTMDWGVVKQGDKIDWALRSGVALTRLLDLGLNVPVGLASNIGEQTFDFIQLGPKKYATGLARYTTPKGREIVNKYENIVGEKFFERMRDTSKSAGEKFHEGIFGLFSTANRRGNSVNLLANLTPEEFAAGTISSEKLAKIRNEIAKYHVVPGKESIVGKTSLGMVGKEYRSWAVPAFHSTIDNLKKISQMAGAKDFKGILKSKEGAELFRGTILTATLLLAGYGYYDNLKNKKDRSFLENLAYKSMNDALSFLGALNPSFWTTPTRLQSFVNDLASSLTNIVAAIATGDRTKDGDIQGIKKFKATVTPAIIKQFGDVTKKEESKQGGLPKLPSLPKLPTLPKLPSLK